MTTDLGSCRQALDDLDLSKGTHAGLLLQKYLRKQDDPKQKETLLNSVCSLDLNTEVYRRAYERWRTSNRLFSDYEVTLTLRNRMIVGLGESNVMEAGLTIHHTYGVPYIPGSAVKGLTAHHCDLFFGEMDSELKKGGEIYNSIFGTVDEAGMIRFYDAWILPESLEKGGKREGALYRDVMTPHHSEYYAQEVSAEPTDFDTPVPVPFLSVSGKFLFSLALERESADSPLEERERNYLRLVRTILIDALIHDGIGAKTSSGYGLFKVEESAPSVTPSAPVAKPQPKKDELLNGKIVKISGNSVSFDIEYEKNHFQGIIKDNKKQKKYHGKDAADYLRNKGISEGDMVPLLYVNASNDLWIVRLVKQE